MKKITFLFFAVCCSVLTYGQTDLPTAAGPIVISDATPVIVNFNDAANAAAVPAGQYDRYSVVADWENLVFAWSSEERLSVVTAAGTTAAIAPTAGGSNTTDPTVLEFGNAAAPLALAGVYDPSVDGSFDLGLSRTYASDSQYTNIVVTLYPVLTCTSATVDSATVNADCVGGTFTVDVVISAIGDATDYDDGSGPVAITGNFTAGPYTDGDVVNITIIHSDPLCNVALGPFSSGCPPSNDLCVDATPIGCGDTLSGSNIGASDGDLVANDGCGTSATAVGVWYLYTGANSNDAGAAVGTVGDTVTASTCGTADFDTEITVYTGSCGAFTCLANNDDVATCAGNSSELEFETLVGTSYYIYVSGFGPAEGLFDLSLSCVAPPLCTTAVIDSSTIVETCNPDGSGTFVIDHVVSVAGDAGTVLSDGVNADVAVTVGTVTTGPYNSGDSVTIELTGTDSACDFTVGTFTFTCPQPPPANDTCAGAISLTPGGTFGDNPLTGQTNAGATDSGEVPLPGCASYDPADASGNGGDVWYAVTVPSDGNLTIETDSDPTGNGGDGGMAVYTGTCGALALFECNDDGGNGLYGQVIIEPTDALADQIVYIRVWEFGGDAVINFQVSAFSATLGLEDVENNASFTYYPNPVQNILTLSAQNTIENVTMYNMLGQEVLRATPKNVDSTLDMSSLQDGTYFVKVTIANVTKTVRVIKQ